MLHTLAYFKQAPVCHMLQGHILGSQYTNQHTLFSDYKYVIKYPANWIKGSRISGRIMTRYSTNKKRPVKGNTLSHSPSLLSAKCKSFSTCVHLPLTLQIRTPSQHLSQPYLGKCNAQGQPSPPTLQRTTTYKAFLKVCMRRSTVNKCGKLIRIMVQLLTHTRVSEPEDSFCEETIPLFIDGDVL